MLLLFCQACTEIHRVGQYFGLDDRYYTLNGLWFLVVAIVYVLLMLSGCSAIYQQPRPPATLFESQTTPDTPTAAPANAVSLAVIGDVPYGLLPSRAFYRLQQAINQERDVSWVLHAGDIKSGAVPCWKWLYRNRQKAFNRFRAPWVLTLGDNEWTDCHRWASGHFAPLNRLAYLRSLFFNRAAIEALSEFQGVSQGFLPSSADQNPFAAFKEHWRWVDRGVMFVSIHAVGSANAERPFKGRTKADDQAVAQRNAALTAWLEASYRWMKDQPDIHSVVILTHANPHFEQAQWVEGEWRFPMPSSSDSIQEQRASQAFSPLLLALKNFVAQAKRPVLLIQGDGHQFRFDQPWQALGDDYQQFWRLQTFGVDANYWVKLRISPETERPFGIQPQAVTR